MSLCLGENEKKKQNDRNREKEKDKTFVCNKYSRIEE
jgi:hypothetical protein